ncbi:MAG: phosphoribosyltransferase [Candidatus Omnitrophica bacterium]|nr:phosphoribosyltransferase [Candidatus Omnitrophota bacterium]
MFEDRKDAGTRLGQALAEYKGTGALVLAIPRGGVEVGYYVARELEAEFSVIITRKLPFPDQPEAGFGAIAEDGSVFIMEGALKWVDPDSVERITRRQKEEIARRKEVFRGGEDIPPLEGRHIILVDDGIAMGSTVRASLLMLRNCGAGRVTVASPVAGPSVASYVNEIADELVVLEKPHDFSAVAQVYRNWHDVTDEEASAFLEQ